MDFRPSKAKIIGSIIIMLVAYVFIVISISNSCETIEIICPPEGCCVNHDIPVRLYSDCNCSGTTVSGFFLQVFFFVSPGILVYIFWSLFERKK